MVIKTMLVAAWITLSLIPVAQAVPVNALAIADGEINLLINDGVALIGVEVTDSLTVLDFDASSALDAADAVKTFDSDAVIAGLDRMNPSQFSGFDRTSRNADSEGAQANYSQFNYGVRVPSPQPGVIANPLVEHGKWGSSQSQAQIDTEPHATAADSVIDTRRLFTFENFSNDPVSFTIDAFFDLSLGALFEEAAGFAQASGIADLVFDSEEPLAITLVPVVPFVFDEASDSDNATTMLTRFDDPGATGMVGLAASASALGVDAMGSEIATVMATDSVLLGVTLAPGQVMTMDVRFILTTAVEIQPLASVPVPGGLLLMLIGLVGLRVHRQ